MSSFTKFLPEISWNGGSICKDLFGGSANENISMHLPDFCDICDTRKFKDIDNAIVKLKLFPFFIKREG
jgi:hypothetical protein